MLKEIKTLFHKMKDINRPELVTFTYYDVAVVLWKAAKELSDALE
jgi:hypothetical protein